MLKKIIIFFTFSFFYGFYSLILGAGLNNFDPRYPLREYRRFILPNKMKVMLISDPTMQKGAASMTIAVGSMNDPYQNFGLAHFLEHMLFLGTKKYPDEGSYQKFISTHDGFSNAYTSGDHTNFHFEIDSDFLEEGLDRFSQFFISPLFEKELVKREIMAIDSEHSKNISNDFRRIFQVKRKAFEIGHPARHFPTGSMETLSHVNRKDMLDFYQKHYSSNQMMLAVAGPQNLETLQNLIVPRFIKVKNRNLVEKQVSTKFMKRDSRFRLMRIKTIKDLRLLKFVFPLSKTLHYYKSRPLGMLGFLIGHEGYGSLLSLLKRKNLATGISAGVGISNKSFSSFDVDIKLTKKGLMNYTQVIDHFFQYVSLLRKTGLPRYIYEEVKLMSEIEYKFSEKLEGTSLVNVFSTLMMYYPMRKIEVSPYIISEYKPRIFDSILYNLTPDNMLTILASQNVNTSKKEEFYGVEYSLTYNNPRWIKKWRNSKVNPKLKLPEINKFLPKRFNILSFKGELEITHQTILGLEKEGISSGVIQNLKSFKGRRWESFDKLLTGISPQAENEETLKHLLRKHVLVKPKVILENNFCKIWFQQDFRFKTPKANLLFKIHSPEVYSSPRNAVLSQLYADAILEGLREFLYPVSISGLNLQINVDKKGINLSFSGFSDKIFDLTKIVTNNLKEIKIDKKTFKSLKDIRKRKYQNFSFQQPYQLAFYYRSLLLEGQKFSINEYEKEINKIQLKHLKQFAKKIFKNIYIEGVAYGNIRPSAVKESIEIFRKNLNAKNLTKEEISINTIRQILPGNTHIFSRKLRNKNSALITEYQIGQRSPELLAQLMLIENLIKPDFYNELRTKQQLGYVVDSSISVIGKTLGLILLIQSGEYNPSTLIQRTNDFIEKFYKSLMNISDFEIKKIKKSILNKKLRKTNSIRNEAIRLFQIAVEQNGEFDINSQEIKAIEKLTREDVIVFFQRFLLPKQRRLILKMIGTDHVKGNHFNGVNSSIANFREKYFCPKNCLP